MSATRVMTYTDIAHQGGLTGMVKRRFVTYMRRRWPDTEEQKCLDGYALVWAQRFKDGQEYAASDGQGKALLALMESGEVEVTRV